MKLRTPICVLLAAAAAFMSDRSSAQTSSPAMCEMLHALPRAQGRQPVLPSAANSRDAQSVSAYLSDRVTRGGQLSISEAERSALAAIAVSHDYAFEPVCDWMERLAAPPKGLSDHYFTFTNPVISADGTLAIVAYAHIISGTGSTGAVCALRKRTDSWEVHCAAPWIT